MKPSLLEAAADLRNIREELKAMLLIRDNALFLCGRDDVDAQFYRAIISKVETHIASGTRLESHILTLYSDLT